MVDWKKVIKENKDEVKIDLGYFKEKISLADLHGLIKKISAIKDGVNVVLNNVEGSLIGDDAKWLLYCTSLLKDKITNLKQPKSDFPIKPSDITVYRGFIEGFRGLIQSAITITKLGGRAQKDKQDNLNDIVTALDVLKDNFSKDDDENIEYNNTSTVAKINLRPINSSVENHVKTLEEQKCKLSDEVKEKITKVSNEIYKSITLPKGSGENDIQLRSTSINNAFENFFDVAKCLDTEAHWSIIIGKINGFYDYELKEMLKQAAKYELPDYVTKAMDDQVQKRKTDLHSKFKKSPFHKELFNLLMEGKGTKLEQKLLVLDLSACVDDASKQQKLVELAKTHCRSIIADVGSDKANLLSSFFDKVEEYLNNSSPRAIGLLRTIEVLSEIEMRLSEEKKKELGTEKTSQPQGQEQNYEKDLVPIIKSWPENRDWPTKIKRVNRTAFFTSVAQAKLIKNKRQKHVDQLLKPMPSENYVQSVFNRGYETLHDLLSGNQRSYTVTNKLPEQTKAVSSENFMPTATAVLIEKNNDGKILPLTVPTYGPTETTTAVAVAVAAVAVPYDENLVNVIISPQNVEPYPVSNITCSGKSNINPPPSDPSYNQETGPSKFTP